MTLNRIKPRQQGIALIMVLLVVAIVSIVATQINGKLQFSLKTAANRADYLQAYWYGLTTEQLIENMLKESIIEDSRITLAQTWANPIHHYPFPEGKVTFTIEDNQNCFNLNALTSINSENPEKQKQALIAQQLEHLANAITNHGSSNGNWTSQLLDWMDADVIPIDQSGAEDLIYTAAKIPFYTTNSSIFRLSELSALPSINHQTIKAIKPWFCALPTTQMRLNLNTLSKDQGELFSALSLGEIAANQLENIVQNRPDKGYNSINEFWTELNLKDADELITLKNQLALRSEFFKATIDIEYRHTTLKWKSYFHIVNGEFKVYLRSYGEEV